MLCTCICEVLGWNLSRVSSCYDFGFLVLLLGLFRQCWDKALIRPWLLNCCKYCGSFRMICCVTHIILNVMYLRHSLIETMLCESVNTTTVTEFGKEARYIIHFETHLEWILPTYVAVTWSCYIILKRWFYDTDSVWVSNRDPRLLNHWHEFQAQFICCSKCNGFDIDVIHSHMTMIFTVIIRVNNQLDALF
jgi:hypothetical protein